MSYCRGRRESEILWATELDFPIPKKKMVPEEERRVRVKKMVSITIKI